MTDTARANSIDFTKLTLRPIKDKDMEFLYRLYASTRQDEMAMIEDWDAQQKAGFLKFQFQAQHTFYTREFRKARFDLIRLKGRPIGRLYVDRRADEIRIIDIALLPEYRGQGIGTKFMQQILAEGADKRLPVRIHVEHFNPARRLYDRLGFREIDENGVYHLMEWRAEEQGSRTTK